MDKTFNVEIITPAKVFYSGKAESVSVPGTKSPFQILFNHAPIVSSLETGIIKILEESGKNHIYATSGGFVEVRNNNVSILVESAEDANMIDAVQTMSDIAELKEKISGLKLSHDENTAIDAAIFKEQLKQLENNLKAAQKAE